MAVFIQLYEVFSAHSHTLMAASEHAGCSASWSKGEVGNWTANPVINGRPAHTSSQEICKWIYSRLNDFHIKNGEFVLHICSVSSLRRLHFKLKRNSVSAHSPPAARQGSTLFLQSVWRVHSSDSEIYRNFIQRIIIQRETYSLKWRLSRISLIWKTLQTRVESVHIF